MFEEIVEWGIPMLKCERCGDEMIDEFMVFGIVHDDNDDV